MELKKNDVLSFYEKIKCFAKRTLQNGDYDTSLKHISIAANAAYMFNFLFKDDELEEMLAEVSGEILVKHSKRSQTGRYVMIDAFGTPNKGLTQQYLRSLISMGVEFLYVSVNVAPSREAIYDEVRTCSNGLLSLVPEVNNVDKVKFIYNQIINYNPDVILTHITPWDVVSTTVLYAFPQILRYNINLTDHAFWLGAGCFDFNIDFRDFGATVSVEKRGFNRTQILINPFYPIIDDSAFLGFSRKVEGKVILFSGGDYYKIYGNNYKFLSMMKLVLENNPQTVLLYAGKGLNKKPLETFIRKNKLTERFILLGERKDINQVFSHIDIYLSTYPIGGGLMTQYAAYNAKPVVAFKDSNSITNDIEDLIFVSDSPKVQLTHTNIESYYNEIKKLIENKSYRVEKGIQLKNALRTKEQFNMATSELLQGGKVLGYNQLDVDYEKIFSHYLRLNNKTSVDLGILLYKRYQLMAFLYFPKVSIKYLFRVVQARVNYKLDRLSR